MRRAPIAVLAATLALAGCAATDAESDPVVEGARATVDAYVDAVASLDLDTANAMTDPRELAAPSASMPADDVTAALPNAIAPIEDPWIAYEGTDFTRLDPDGQGETTDVVWFTVSFTIAGIAGADHVQVTRIGDDESDVGAWLVTDPLLVEAESFVDDTIDVASFGGVEIETAGDDAYRPVWGYPALYVLEAIALAPDVPSDAVVTPLEVPIGVTIEPRWDESLRMLQVEKR